MLEVYSSRTGALLYAFEFLNKYYFNVLIYNGRKNLKNIITKKELLNLLREFKNKRYYFNFKGYLFNYDNVISLIKNL